MKKEQIEKLISETDVYLTSISSSKSIKNADMPDHRHAVYKIPVDDNMYTVRLYFNWKGQKTTFAVYGKFDKPYPNLGNRFSGKYNFICFTEAYELADLINFMEYALEQCIEGWFENWYSKHIAATEGLK